MDGITILNNYTCEIQDPSFNLQRIIIPVIVGGLTIIILLVLYAIFENLYIFDTFCNMMDNGIVVAIIVILSVYISYFLCSTNPKYNKDIEIYEIIIDDTVKFNEFYDKYRVISKNGNIYTVEKIK